MKLFKIYIIRNLVDSLEDWNGHKDWTESLKTLFTIKMIDVQIHL